MVRQWNAATATGNAAQLDAAARTMGSTAGELRTLAGSSKDAGFATRARTAAGELDKMKRAREQRQSVRTGDYNTAARNLRNYCSERIGGTAGSTS